MAGLMKAKKYDWKDSNLALFGSDTEKQVSQQCMLMVACVTSCLRMVAGKEGLGRDGAGLERSWTEGQHADLENRQVQGKATLDLRVSPTAPASLVLLVLTRLQGDV